MSPFEIGMLVCFGISWPISIWKQYRSKRSDGKSLRFGSIVVLGYVCGVLHKVFYNYDAVIFLYLLNITFVLIDLSLTIHYRKRPSSLAA